MVIALAFPVGGGAVKLPPPDAPPPQFVAPSPGPAPVAPRVPQSPSRSESPSPRAPTTSAGAQPAANRAAARRRALAAKRARAAEAKAKAQARAAARRRAELRERRLEIGARRRAAARAALVRVTAEPARPATPLDPGGRGPSAALWGAILAGIAAMIGLIAAAWVGWPWTQAGGPSGPSRAHLQRADQGQGARGRISPRQGIPASPLVTLGRVRRRIADADLPAVRLASVDVLVLGMAGLALALAVILWLASL